MTRRHEFSLPCGDQQTELLEHPVERMARTIIPPQDPLSCVAAAQKLDRSSGVGGAEFAGDVEEQSAFGYGDVVESACGAGSCPQHRDTILQHRAFDLFVRIDAGHYADDFVGST